MVQAKAPVDVLDDRAPPPRAAVTLDIAHERDVDVLLLRVRQESALVGLRPDVIACPRATVGQYDERRIDDRALLIAPAALVRPGRQPHQDPIDQRLVQASRHTPIPSAAGRPN
jgi:hypothetical protein